MLKDLKYISRFIFSLAYIDYAVAFPASRSNRNLSKLRSKSSSVVVRWDILRSKWILSILSPMHNKKTQRQILMEKPKALWNPSHIYTGLRFIRCRLGKAWKVSECSKQGVEAVNYIKGMLLQLVSRSWGGEFINENSEEPNDKFDFFLAIRVFSEFPHRGRIFHEIICYFFWQINPIGMWQGLSNQSPSRVPNNIFPIPAQFSTNLPFGSFLSQPWNPFSSVWSSQIHLPSFTESESPIQYIPTVTKNSSFKNLLMAL